MGFAKFLQKIPSKFLNFGSFEKSIFLAKVVKDRIKVVKDRIKVVKDRIKVVKDRIKVDRIKVVTFNN